MDSEATDTKYVFASTQRASRAARPPEPSVEAQKLAWLKISQCADALEGQLDSMELDATGDCGAAKQQQPVGLQRVTRLAPTAYASALNAAGGGYSTGGAAAATFSSSSSNRSTAGSESSSKGTEIVPVKTTVEIDASVPARPTATLSHVSLHSRSIEAAAREPTYLSYQCVLPLVGAQLAAAGCALIGAQFHRGQARWRGRFAANAPAQPRRDVLGVVWTSRCHCGVAWHCQTREFEARRGS